MNYSSFGNIAEWKKSGVMNNFGFWNIAEWEKSGVINNDAFWNIAEWDKLPTMMSIPKKTAKTVEPDAPPFGTGRIKTWIQVWEMQQNVSLQIAIKNSPREVQWFEKAKIKECWVSFYWGR